MSHPGAQAVRNYHEATKHSAWSIRSSRHFLDWENQPLPFKIYRGVERVPLPRDVPQRDVSALTAVADSSRARRDEGPERVPDLAALARVLFLAAGITKQRRHPGGTTFFRAYPNTGALHHVDLYLVAGPLPDLAAGVYHFAPHDFSLGRLREGDFRGALVEASGGSAALASAPVVVAGASTWWRNSWKYQARAWRHVFWDGGTLHANLLAAAATEGLEPEVLLGWADAPVETLLGLDREAEGAIALVPLGRCAGPPPASPPLRPLQPDTEPLSPNPQTEPEIRAAQRASSLRDAAEARRWRESTPERSASQAPRGALVPLPTAREASAPGPSLDRVIRRRGSTRAFDATRALSFEALATALDMATRGIPADWLAPDGTTQLDLALIVHAVEGLAPGAYAFRRDARALDLLEAGEFRETAGALALGQALAADAAVNVYSLAALDPILARHGGRGYRAAQLEGGITGGRLYLAAYAQGFGATGLTFFDDDVIDFFSPFAAGRSVMFLTALGYADRAALGLA